MPDIFVKEHKIYYFNAKRDLCPIQFSKKFSELLQPFLPFYEQIIFICIGTDRAVGDCLGPMVGEKLAKSISHPCMVYGTLKHPIHAQNLIAFLSEIRSKHPRGLFIAIDASLGEEKHLGYITLEKGPLKPGLGVSKDLPEIGHLCITGIVNFYGTFDPFLSQTTRLYLVMSLVEAIRLGIELALKNLFS